MLTSHKIPLDSIQEGLILTIEQHSDNSLDVNDDGNNHEAKYQIKEGYTYDFSLSDDNYSLQCPYHKSIVLCHKANKSLGTIKPNIYVGTLTLEVYNINNPDEQFPLIIEVQSVKTDYRKDYQFMLNDIAEKCTDIILNSNSPVNQTLEIDPDVDNQSLYQRFAFIKSMIEGEEFDFTIHKIINNPSTQWMSIDSLIDVRKVKRFSNRQVRSLISGPNRIIVPESHPLTKVADSISYKITSSHKYEDYDTNENRFVKHAISSYKQLCKRIAEHKNAGTQLTKEAELLTAKLDNILKTSFFKSISRPQTLNLNSPLLQRKAGYREQLKLWLKFDLAAKLVWSGGDDVYKAGKKDIATLYEYWLFFQLLSVVEEIFHVDALEVSKLIVHSSQSLNLQLRQGKFTAINGVYTYGKRSLKIRFNYNKSFKGHNESTNREQEGSWTTTMRPDYTLSIWPEQLTDKQAEKEEQIVHIHFDAKYKLANLKAFSDVDLDAQKRENKKAVYKNADLLKMHTYKDAIRRTSGAYVLYPGSRDRKFNGFHEVLPGLGAFPIAPKAGTNQTKHLESFLREVLDHFLNRASQRENISNKTYQIIKGGIGDALHEAIPEYINGEKLIPDETYVLVGYCRSPEQYRWIEKLRNTTLEWALEMDHYYWISKQSILNIYYFIIKEMCLPVIFGKSLVEDLKFIQEKILRR